MICSVGGALPFCWFLFFDWHHLHDTSIFSFDQAIVLSLNFFVGQFGNFIVEKRFHLAHKILHFGFFQYFETGRVEIVSWIFVFALFVKLTDFAARWFVGNRIDIERNGQHNAFQFLGRPGVELKCFGWRDSRDG